MTFAREDHWVWDFWIADDGDRYHLFYLHAPTSLGDERLRHRNARIGHAVSRDLREWVDLGTVLVPGGPGEFDATAVWTGCVVQGGDGVWRMFYTGSHFLGEESIANIESVGVATSRDLHTWEPSRHPVATADPRWYETLADGTWREEAWRDPWVFPDPDGDGWHMLVTARARSSHAGADGVLDTDGLVDTDGLGDDRGVIGHAVSADLEHWEVRPPLSAPGAGFTHLEVPQLVKVDGADVLLFSCDARALAGPRSGGRGGVWQLPVEAVTGPFDPSQARLLVDDGLYAGRIVHDRAGDPVLLAFENGSGEEFVGRISDPVPLRWDAEHGCVAVAAESRA
ncbi:glycoside hydrolase family 68 protein [Microbacterium sp. LjRoot45]|uniref:glycoside hydrolase family 68 protein n=1 Tax=Microbacterium sp. LjRoot45 TaxID=3342329 RepID=UPI003ED11E83